MYFESVLLRVSFVVYLESVLLLVLMYSLSQLCCESISHLLCVSSVQLSVVNQFKYVLSVPL